MRLALCGFLIALTARASTDARSILDHVEKVYGSLRSFHIVAFRQISVPGYGHSVVEYELAEKPGGIYRLKEKRGRNESISASNGAKTWKASSNAREWMQINATASSAGDATPDQTVTPNQDFHEVAKYLMLSRFVLLAKTGERPEFVKEGVCKLGGDKVECDIVRVNTRDAVHELWVDRARGLVLQDEEKRHQRLGSTDAVVDTILKVKDVEIDADVANTAFEFKPEPSWREVEALILPGEAETGNLLGTKAGEFSLKSLVGQNVQLSDLHGQVVVLNFWATWCPPCREELPGLDQLRTELGEKATFFAITDEDGVTARVYLNKSHNGLPVLLDSRDTVHRQYSVRAIPTLLVIDREGVIRVHFVGGRDIDTIRKAVAKVVGSGPGA